MTSAPQAIAPIAVTMGDPAGVGPEICCVAAVDPQVLAVCRPVVIGDLARLQQAATIMGVEVTFREITDPSEADPRPDRIDVIQVGSLLSNDPVSGSNLFLLRWRADGQPDTGIGAHGVREYALDFAGDNPPESYSNADSANAIVRQGDGKYVVLGGSYIGTSYATTVLRLRRDFGIDPTFGDGGALQHLVEIATTGDHGLIAGTALVQPGRILAAGVAFTGINGRIQTVFSMENDLLFADGFE